MDQLHYDDTYQTVIATYARIHMIFFVIGKYFIGVVSGLCFFWGLVSATHQDIQDSITHTSNVNQQSITGHTHLEPKIMYGSITQKSGLTQSFDNILLYHNLILPRYVVLTGEIEIATPTRAGLTASGDTRDAINAYLNQYIYIPYDIQTQTSKKRQNTSASSDRTLVDTFHLQCMTMRGKVTSYCTQNIQSMIDALPAYNLTASSDELMTLHTTIRNEYRETLYPQFCTNIQNNLLYTHKITPRVQEIMNKEHCGLTFERTYNDLLGMQVVSEQLSVGFIKPEMVNNSLLDTYKLVSLQQYIYTQGVNKKISLDVIDSYITYMRDLLSHDGVQDIYYDITVAFNMNYLIPHLTQYSISQQGVTAANTIKAIENIRKLYEGDQGLGYPGLKNKMRHKLSVASGEVDTAFVLGSDQDMMTYRSKLPAIAGWEIKSSTSIDKQTIGFQATVRYPATHKENTTKRELVAPIVGTMAFDGQSFVLSSIAFGTGSTYIQRNDALKSLIKQGNTTLGSLYNPLLNIIIQKTSNINKLQQDYNNKKDQTDIPKETTKPTNTGDASATISITELFGSWINGTVKSVVTKGSYYNTIFVLDETTYITTFDLKTKTMRNIGYILGDGSILVVKGFSMPFKSSKEFTQFKANPTSVLLQYDPLTVKQALVGGKTNKE